MRLILATIILTMLAQPVWASSVEDLIGPCTDWKDIGYKDGFTNDDKGINALTCAVYMMALRDFGLQNCQWEVEDIGVGLSWQASAPQLAQFFLNKAEKKPEWWNHNAYGFFAMSRVADSFPCKD